MAYQVLSLKWRPRKFQDVIGQDHIVRSLQNALSGGTPGHAYLFSGTRGVGKTSVARVFAKALRCESLSDDGNACGVCNACLDFEVPEASMNIYELDGASNNKVEDVRELIGAVGGLPTSGRSKVYIIDEAHMLSIAAFNALLKTLEEPPEHVVFILATTRPDKLPDTVVSRCQRFDFKCVNVGDISKLVERIAAAESIVFENRESVKTICRQGRGSVRDTLSLLEQVLSYTDDKLITEDVLVSALGLVAASEINSLVGGILRGEQKLVIDLVDGMLEENVMLDTIAALVLERLYHIITSSKDMEGISPAEAIWIYENFARDINWALEGPVPDKSLRVVFKKVTMRRTLLGFQAAADVGGEEQSTPRLQGKTQGDLRGDPPLSQGLPSTAESESLGNNCAVDSEKMWEGFISHLRKSAPTLSLNLEQGDADVSKSGSSLTVNLRFDYSGKVFYTYLSVGEAKERIISNLSQFFSVDAAGINLNLSLQRETLKSFSDVEMEQKRAEEELAKQEIAGHSAVKTAEQVFNSRVKEITLS